MGENRESKRTQLHRVRDQKLRKMQQNKAVDFSSAKNTSNIVNNKNLNFDLNFGSKGGLIANTYPVFSFLLELFGLKTSKNLFRRGSVLTATGSCDGLSWKFSYLQNVI